MKTQASAPLTAEQKNNKEIKEFFEMYGEETHAVYSAFLFDMLNYLLISDDYGGEWTTEYMQDVVWKFNQVNNLIASLRKPA